MTSALPIRIFILPYFFLTLLALQGQAQSHSLNAPLLPNSVRVDGLLNERVWQELPSVSGFALNYPFDSLGASEPTEVKVFYSKKFIYVGVKCFNSKGNDRFVRSLKRDFGRNANDAFAVILDPLHDQTNGFAFIVNPEGVLSEALIHSGSRLDAVWDNKWSAETAITEEYWSVEIRIPFRTLRYKPSNKTWGINFIRNDIATNELSCWSPVPREFDPYSLVFAGDIHWQKELPAQTGKASLIPYTAAGYQRGGNGKDAVTRYDIGGDVKLPVSSSLNLDLTINPDFSQVEADQQQINLDRFSLFFPERRNFFIENNDLFANFGFSKIRPFFSRRIGLDDDRQLTPIFFGARLSGKLNQDWRIGLLNVQAASSRPEHQGWTNYTVGTFQRQIKANNLAGIVVNKSSLKKNGDEDYNRIVGLDYNILSKDQRLRGKVFYHQSFTDDNKDFQYAHASWLTYKSRTVTYNWNHEFVDKSYTAEAGFVPREGRGYWRLEPSVHKLFYPENSFFNSHGPSVYYDLYTNEQLEKTDQTVKLSYNFNFQNTSSLRFHYTNTFVQLLQPFNPNRADPLKFPDSAYTWNDVSFNFSPVGRNRLSFSCYGQYGSFYLGEKYTYGGAVNYRVEPFVQLSLNAAFNLLKMPQPYLNDNLMLISPKVDISFTDKLFLSSFVQLNQQIQNLALNTRLQYRFKPMSDLFIVYNQNIDSETAESLNQALVLKFSYWLNV